MQQNKYKIQALVEQGYNFSKLYPEKQAIVQEMTGANFSIPEIVDFIRSQTNNFEQENLVALDLDSAIYKLYVQQEGKKEEAPKEEAPKAPESPSGKVSKAVLETRLKIIKKQLQKDPSNSIFKTRKKIVEKLISQYADGGSMKYAEGGGVDRIMTMPKSMVEEIKDSVRMGYNQVQVGMISPKRKGVMLMNTNYEVRGTYPLEYKEFIEDIVSGHYANGGNISDRTNYLPNRDIRAVVTDKGKVISGNDVVDGAYVKKRIKFEDGGEMMHFGQYAKGGETGKYTITLYFGGEQESEIYLNVTKEEAKELSMRAEHSVVEDAYGNIVEVFARGGKPKMIRTIFEEEEFEYGLGGIFGSQRSKAALMKDRAYKSEQPWEKNYKRKKAPKNPRYK